MYRIYINDTVLIIADFVPGGIGPNQRIDVQSFDFKEFYKHVKKGEGSVYVLLTDEPRRMFKKIRKPFLTIKAAGGVVKNEANQYLFIFRKGKWDLPKGKLDEGESTKIAAEREVAEECGIKVLSVGGKLCKTWHVYEDRGQTVFKKTSWYKMKAKKQKLVPQLEEDITEARWIDAGDFSFVRQNTFPLIKDIISLLEV